MSQILTLEIAQQLEAEAEDRFDADDTYYIEASLYTSITDEAAEALAIFNGYLALDGLTSLSDAAAEALAKHKHGLSLSGLTSLSDTPGHVALAVKLARQEGDLYLRGLTSLSDAAAKALADHDGKVHFEALPEKDQRLYYKYCVDR